MDSQQKRLPRRVSRRAILTRAAGLAGLAAVGGCRGPSESAGGPAGRPPAAGMKMWWWGEQEATGITRWLDDTIAKFKARTGISITPTLMDTDNVIPQFTTAAAAGNVPDIQFFFNGIYHIENAWLGYVSPLNDLLPADLLKRCGATRLSSSGGKQFRVGFYANGFGVAYNKELFNRAKLDAEKPPTTWDQFLNACDRL